MPRFRTFLPALLAALLMSLATSSAGAASYAPLPVGTDVDYQLGGARTMPAHVGIVERDHGDAPQAGRYNICYVNGFQTQAEERTFWQHHSTLVLHRRGKPVVDSAWDEWLLDIRSSANRAHLARIMTVWITSCATKGYDAVEFDNLDSYTRSHGLLTRSEAVAYARLLVTAAHTHGLAAGQKNLADWDGHNAGYDFAIAEECGRYRECSDYTRHYGRQVIAIEYRTQDFAWTCQHFGGSLPVELRDRDLTPGGVHRWC